MEVGWSGVQQRQVPMPLSLPLHMLPGHRPVGTTPPTARCGVGQAAGMQPASQLQRFLWKQHAEAVSLHFVPPNGELVRVQLVSLTRHAELLQRGAQHPTLHLPCTCGNCITSGFHCAACCRTLEVCITKCSRHTLAYQCICCLSCKAGFLLACLDCTACKSSQLIKVLLGIHTPCTRERKTWSPTCYA